jgi:hypothetical protein
MVLPFDYLLLTKFNRLPERIVGIFSLLSFFGKRSRISNVGRLSQSKAGV